LQQGNEINDAQAAAAAASYALENPYHLPQFQILTPIYQRGLNPSQPNNIILNQTNGSNAEDLVRFICFLFNVG
jgi:hypothetical protein